MFDLVDEAFKEMISSLNKISSTVTLEKAEEIEQRINEKREELKIEYLDSLSKDKELDMESGVIYSNIFASLERVGDHIINVSEGIIGKI